MNAQSLVEPDYHPDKLEALLLSGDDARMMLGRIAQNAVTAAPEEWEMQRWRPPGTPIDELFGGAEEKTDDGEADQYEGLNSHFGSSEDAALDPMNNKAAMTLAEKLKVGLQRYKSAAGITYIHIYIY